MSILLSPANLRVCVCGAWRAADKARGGAGGRAFSVHIGLCESRPCFKCSQEAANVRCHLSPFRADFHWRGPTLTYNKLPHNVGVIYAVLKV